MDEEERRLKEKMIDVMTDIRSGLFSLNSRLHEVNENLLSLEEISESMKKLSGVAVELIPDHSKGKNVL